jgi:hypothetical protein
MTPADFRELRRLAQLDAKKRAEGCWGKTRYATRSEAERSASYAHRRRCVPYRCTFCGAWHKGSIIGERVRRRGLRTDDQ